MAKSIFKFLESVKESSFYGGAAIRPVQPFPNSIAAKQIEQQEAAEEATNSPDNQLMQTQKAQQDAVNQLQQAQQQIQQLQGELQNVQMSAQQQAQQAQMMAEQEAQKAKLDAQYELQAEKIKNQKALLSMQEKYMKGMQKQPKDQGGILANQLKRVVSRVSKLAAEKKAAVNRIPSKQEWQAMTPEQRQQVSGGDVPLLSNIPDFASNLGREVKDYWKDPRSYIGESGASKYINPETGESTFFNTSSALGGGKPLSENLSGGNYLGAAGNLLGAVPDMFSNMALTGGVLTGSGISNLARGNVSTGLRDTLTGGLTTATAVSPISAGRNLLTRAAAKAPSYTMSIGGKLPVLRNFTTAPTKIRKAINAIPDATGKAVNTTILGSEYFKRLLPTKSGAEDPSIFDKIKNFASNIGDLGQAAGQYFGILPAAPASPPPTNAITIPIAPPGKPAPPPAPPPPTPPTPPPPAPPTPPAVTPESDNIISKALAEWAMTPMTPALEKAAPYSPMHRTNIEYLQNNNISNRAWAYPMLGNEKRPNFGFFGNLIGDVVGNLYPAFRVGRMPESGVVGKSLSYEPKYKLNTSVQ